MYGPESSGKTTLALHAMAAVQRAGGTALLVDAEHAFDAQYSKVTTLDTPHLAAKCQVATAEINTLFLMVFLKCSHCIMCLLAHGPVCQEPWGFFAGDSASKFTTPLKALMLLKC